MLAGTTSLIIVHIDILFEHVEASGTQGDHGDIRERRRYPVDKHDVLELAGGTSAQLPAVHR